MKRLGLWFLILQLATLQWAAAESRIAVLRFEDILSEMADYQRASEKMVAELDKIPLDSRNTQLQKTIKELDKLLTQLNGSTTVGKRGRAELIKKVINLRQEAETLRVDYEAYDRRETKRIKQQMLDALTGIHRRIREAAAAVAEERGYDCLFEIKGSSNTSLPVLVYAKDPLDITADVLAALQAAEPAKPAKSPNTTR